MDGPAFVARAEPPSLATQGTYLGMALVGGIPIYVGIISVDQSAWLVAVAFLAVGCLMCFGFLAAFLQARFGKRGWLAIGTEAIAWEEGRALCFMPRKEPRSVPLAAIKQVVVYAGESSNPAWRSISVFLARGEKHTIPLYGDAEDVIAATSGLAPHIPVSRVETR